MYMNIFLVKQLVKEQFPQWADLPIRAVEPGGIDNWTFRLGDTMLVRMPSAEGYATQVEKEQKWLPILAPHLSVRIPEPIAMGEASEEYPWKWSIYKWIEGEEVTSFQKELARDLAHFLKELQAIDAKEGPAGGLHNYHRGCHLSVYDAIPSLERLKEVIDFEKALVVWERALDSKWERDPVWVHGDVAKGNLLLKDGRLHAVIDFGCLGVGDPACDLVMAWTYFQGEERRVFMEEMGLDGDTWDRARGWALWKAAFELEAMEDKNSPEGLERQRIIREITLFGSKKCDI